MSYGRPSMSYRTIMVKGHPRANRDGLVLEHIVICEKALGKFLPTGVEVHHANRNHRDNSNSNLVICQDRAYHMLLHQRLRAFAECGNAGWRKCHYCKRYDDPTNLSFPKSSDPSRNILPYHKACAAEYQLRRSQTP